MKQMVADSIQLNEVQTIIAGSQIQNYLQPESKKDEMKQKKMLMIIKYVEKFTKLLHLQ